MSSMPMVSPSQEGIAFFAALGTNPRSQRVGNKPCLLCEHDEKTGLNHKELLHYDPCMFKPECPYYDIPRLMARKNEFCKRCQEDRYLCAEQLSSAQEKSQYFRLFMTLIDRVTGERQAALCTKPVFGLDVDCLAAQGEAAEHAARSVLDYVTELRAMRRSAETGLKYADPLPHLKEEYLLQSSKPERVEFFAKLSDQELWDWRDDKGRAEWEQFMELHRRDVADWRKKFPEPATFINEEPRFAVGMTSLNEAEVEKYIRSAVRFKKTQVDEWLKNHPAQDELKKYEKRMRERVEAIKKDRVLRRYPDELRRALELLSLDIFVPESYQTNTNITKKEIVLKEYDRRHAISRRNRVTFAAGS